MVQLTRDQTFKVVCNIRTPISPGEENVGTGVFIHKDNKAYLVTATHVSNATNDNSYIILCDQSNNPMKRMLTGLNASLKWVDHKTEDISVLEIGVESNPDILCHRCFPYDQIEFNVNKISRDDELTSVGFPHGFGAIGKFSPFTFRSHASSSEITLNRADTNTPAVFICLENPSVGGYSGGPIFDLGMVNIGIMTSSQGPTRLIGIMHGTISDQTGGKIALFSPALFLKDLV